MSDDELTYECNEKHKLPWQRGRRGSLCPREIDGPTAEKLLKGSLLVSKFRFAVWEGRPFKAFMHSPGRWHGFPVGWKEVPEQLRRKFFDEKKVTKADLRRFWLNGGDDA